MQKNQLILIGVALALLAILYLGGIRNSNDAHAGHEHNNAQNDGQKPPMQGGMPSNNVEPANFTDIYGDAKKQLGDSIAKESELAEQAAAKNTPVAFKDIAEFWERQKNLNVAAHYYKKAALLENTEKSITFAGNLFLLQMNNTQEAEIKEWQAIEAIECFNKVSEINPQNLNTKIALANCYIDGTGEIMKGVGALKEVTATDSTNIQANILLGKLSVKSGQLEKAVKRFNTVLSQDSKNTEALYFLAEAHKNMGNKEKAIELFEQCKKIVNSPDFSAEIDNYIKTFK